MLADFEIQRALQDDWIGIRPFREEQLQPVSYDLTLASSVLVPAPGVHTVDPGMKAEDDHVHYGWVPADGPYTVQKSLSPAGTILEPHGFLLACTEEKIELSAGMAARVEGKSSLGRIGLAIHVTAGFIDPGFEGQVTLEIANLAPWSVVLYPGMPIAQIVFEPVSVPERDYSKTGHYQGQMGPTSSRYHFER